MSTIDYKALAERLSRLADEFAAFGHHTSEQRVDDLRTVVSLLRHPAPQPTAIPAPFMHLLGHAYGLSLGTDWNRGTHAKHYRRPLLDAVAECKRWLGSAPPPQPEPAPEGWRWMRHPEWNGGQPIPVRVYSDGDGRWYQPFDHGATEFDWDLKDYQWETIAAPQPERQPVSEPTEAQIEAAADALIDESNRGDWEYDEACRVAAAILRAALTAQEQPK